MMIDCDACAARGPACGDCVVTVLLGAPPANRPGQRESMIDLDGDEQAAIAALADSGLVPPLRLVAAVSVYSSEYLNRDPDSALNTGRLDGQRPDGEHPDDVRRAAV